VIGVAGVHDCWEGVNEGGEARDRRRGTWSEDRQVIGGEARDRRRGEARDRWRGEERHVTGGEAGGRRRGT
jgi:hypothetical protein